MGNLESAYEYRGLADYYVASEAIVWLPRYHPLYLDNITSSTDPKNLAKAMAVEYSDLYQQYSQGVASTISVVDLNQVTLVAEKTNNLANAIRANWGLVASDVWEKTDYRQLQHFDIIGDSAINNYDYQVDLYHFAMKMNEINLLKPTATELIVALEDYIVENFAWSGEFDYDGELTSWDHSNAYGVSISLPRFYRFGFYNEDWLDFAGLGTAGDIKLTNSDVKSSSNWKLLMEELILEFNPEAEVLIDPPELISPLIAPEEPSTNNIYLPMLVR
jgi:hypothetical protein